MDDELVEYCNKTDLAAEFDKLQKVLDLKQNELEEEVRKTKLIKNDQKEKFIKLNHLKNILSGLTERIRVARISKELETKNTRITSTDKMSKTEEKTIAIMNQKMKHIMKCQVVNGPYEMNNIKKGCSNDCHFVIFH